MPGADVWNPDQYNRFAAEREQPFWDLAGLMEPVASPSVVDLGCGDGRLTAALHARLEAATTLGVDSSTAMLEAASVHTSDDVTFAVGDLTTWQENRSFDIVFANASMQWIPDHRAVLGRWVGALRSGGQVAVQIPANHDQPSHLVAARLAEELLDEPPPDPVASNLLSPEEYAEVLYGLGCRRQHVRLQVYTHLLDSSEDVVEWVKGTMLNRFKEPLGAGWDDFVVTYRQRLLAEIGEHSPYLFPFKRILMWGRLD